MRTLLAAVAATWIAAASLGAESVEEQLWHHRNLGKAFYENPATRRQAVGEFKTALELSPDSVRERINYGLALLRAGLTDAGVAELERAQKQDPTIPHTWFNLGIVFHQAGRYAEALAQFQGMVRLVPDEPISYYNLGVLCRLEGRPEEALEHFRRAAELDPDLAAPHYQLASAYRREGRLDEAKRALATFNEIKERNARGAVEEDLEWSIYAEIYETIEPRRVPDSGAELGFEPRSLAGGLDPATAGLAVVDADGDGQPDLLAWSVRGVRLWRNGSQAVASGLEELAPLAVAPGDFDNDGLADLCVVTRAGAALYVNRGGKFEKYAAALPAGSFREAVWLDFDHDYDVDLFLLGARSTLMRNNGATGFSDQTTDFPFVAGQATAGTTFDLVADTQGMDLVVAYADRSGVLYRDRLAGRYEAQPLADLPAGAAAVAARDVDNDGWTDLVAAGASVVLLLNNHRQGFASQAGPEGSTAPIVFADFHNRAIGDLVAGRSVYRNQGRGHFASPEKPSALPPPMALAAADFDADGRVDLAAVGDDGRLVLLANRTVTRNRWLRVGLAGVKNLKLAPGAEVEVKAGTSYQKRLYRGWPLLFGLGGYEQADAVRITWPNGLIQNEARQEAGQSLRYEDAPRLSGSCPMIFTWNGEEWEFITDVLGVAPLGASAGGGEYFPVDHDEYVQIAAESLAARDGEYEIRITEELREVSYLDEIRLIAVDHPSEIEIFTNDKFKGPPFPEFRLFGVGRRSYPASARDHHGRDVRDRLLVRDRTYPDGFRRNYAGVAELHHLDLDFAGAAAGGNAVLVLSGWVDWADGSTFLGASQESSEGLVMPYLQVKDAAGRWQTVIGDMGIPAGKPKTIVVDLSGRFLSASREVRIITNLCVYWDEIFLSEETLPPPVRLTDLHARSAELRFRGFSRVVIHPERKQPERFVYADRRPLSMWNPTRGLYTRYGDVRPLLEEIDDRLVMMGSGDELRLLFDAAALPTLEAGWKRDFLLLVDGWAKDADANTAHSQTVGPLPYHGMPQYPYVAPHRFPDDEEHRRYQELYNVRPALRLIRPLYHDLRLRLGEAGNSPPYATSAAPRGGGQ